MRLLIAVLPAAALLVACGEATTVADPAPGDTDPGLVTTSHPVTVLDDGDGAVLCLGGVMESLPPQCDGPMLVGWDWSAHEGSFEKVRGVRWGEFVVTGEYDGSDFAVTEVTPAAEWEAEPAHDESDFSTPCPEPDDGWRVLDPALTTERSQNRTMRLAAGMDDYAGAWVDQSLNPTSAKLEDPDYEPSLEDELAMNDPTKLVINVLVTGDPAAAEAQLRKVWGGALCVTRAEHTQRELRRVQRELSDTPGFLGSGIDTVGNRVELGVIHDDGSLQRQLDEKYGAGVVHVDSALVPASDPG